MSGLIKKIFIGLLTGLVNGFNHAKCVSLTDQKCMIQSTLINLHSNKYRQEFQLQYAPDVNLITQAHVHPCVSSAYCS